MKTRSSILSPVTTAVLATMLLLCSAIPARAQWRFPFPPFCGGAGQRSCVPFALCGIGPFPPCPTPACGQPGTPACASTQLDTYFNVSQSDNIINLVNPIGTGTTNTCAMIYVFDNNEEMGACCGCPLSPQKVSTLSVDSNLLANFIPFGSPPGIPLAGLVEVVSAPPNQAGGGCNPGNNPGYKPAPDVKAYITHYAGTTGVPEVSFAEAGDPTPITLGYLQAECGGITGNSTGKGVCSCGN